MLRKKINFMKISITGTPGVGKTRVTKLLARELNFEVIELGEIVKKSGLADSYDKKRKALIVNIGKLKKEVKRLLKGKKNVIIEGHLSHFIPSDIVIVLRLDPKILKKRLERRGYPEFKIRENVEAELLDVILVEAIENNKNVVQINTTNKKPEEIVERIKKILKKKRWKSDKVDWLKKYGDELEKLVDLK